jgi:hypothetical protein
MLQGHTVLQDTLLHTESVLIRTLRYFINCRGWSSTTRDRWPRVGPATARFPHFAHPTGNRRRQSRPRHPGGDRRQRGRRCGSRGRSRRLRGERAQAWRSEGGGATPHWLGPEDNVPLEAILRSRKYSRRFRHARHVLPLGGTASARAKESGRRAWMVKAKQGMCPTVSHIRTLQILKLHDEN